MSSRTISPASSVVDIQTLVKRFAQQVVRTPHNVALSASGVELTYAALNARANQVAHRLRRCGVGPEELVGILVERTAETVVGILGILKAGGAYVPVDPAAPLEKRTFVIQDSQLRFFLNQGSEFPCDEHVQQLSLDHWPGEFATELTSEPAPLGNAENLAYVIYTSGSTGRPKGVQVEHRHVDRLFSATEAWFQFGEQDVWSLFHSCAFDFSVWELWGALRYGGRLVVVPREAVQSIKLFRQLLRDEQVTVLNQTPSAFGQLMRVDQKQGSQLGDTLRYVIFGGEALDVPSLKPWMDRYGDEQPQLINMYGITETTVHCTYRRITEEDLERSASPIGEPIPDLQLQLRGAEGHSVPAGEVGEIYVTGAGVTRGYLRRPELNASRFLRGESGAGTVYRSGDLARRTLDGGLDFVGRADTQVKVRGFRIELGEVEAQLRSAPGVGSCAVALNELESTRRQQLVAYVVPKTSGPPPEAGALRSYLRRTLPPYMIPSLYVELVEFPLTSNAKLDRTRLPEPDLCRSLEATGAGPVVLPRSATEEFVSRAWSKVLGQAPPSVTIDFFECGGDSLSLMDLSAELETCFHRSFPVQDLVQATSVAEQAAWLRCGPQFRPWSPLVPLKSTGDQAPFFCVHPGGGNALCYRAVAAAFPADRPFVAIQAHGVDGLHSQLETVEEMAAAYVDAMRELQPQGPYHLGGWSFGGLVAFEMARRLREAKQEVATLAIIDAGLQHSLAVVRTLFLHDEVPLFHMSSLNHESLIPHFRAPSMEAQLVPPGASDERVGNILKVFVKNCDAVFGFRPQSYGGAATLILATEDLVRVRLRRTPLIEWTEYCRGGVNAVYVPGNHLTMIHPPHAADLAAAIAAACDANGPVEAS